MHDACEQAGVPLEVSEDRGVVHVRFMRIEGQRAVREDVQTPQVTPQVGRLLEVLGNEELSLRDCMGRLGLVDRKHFLRSYLNPALEAGLIARTTPENPRNRNQRYKRTTS
jgi:ATP-dependent DNA helicase RecG